MHIQEYTSQQTIMGVSYPKIIHPDRDIVTLYDRLWTICEESWARLNDPAPKKFKCPLIHPQDETINQFNIIMSTFFLVYSDIPVTRQLDFFYERQEKDGAIYSDYSIEDGSVVKTTENPLGIGAPLFAWAEYNLYHKLDSKKRIQAVVKVLEKYWKWLESTCQRENGLYSVPPAAAGMSNSPRSRVKYPIDFNLQQAISANFMARLGDIINDKDLSFRYHKKYFSLRTHINNLMWSHEERFYFDLDKDGQQIKRKTIAAFWALLAQLPNEQKLEGLLGHLSNPKEFAQTNAFPTLPKDDRMYKASGEGYRGSVFPPHTYMIIKGLEYYSAFKTAKQYAAQHIHAIAETIKLAHTDSDPDRGLAEAYRPEEHQIAAWEGKKNFPKARYFPYLGLTAIALVIENIIGLKFSLVKKTVELTMTGMEALGIENVALRKNLISIICDQTNRGWEIHLESEKLYYFTLHVLNRKQKTLPIPSGRCSLLIGKL